jgi:hypothetical protein
VQLSRSQGDHCNPAVAVDSRGVLYAAWQENERGVWSVRMSMSADGLQWSEPLAVADSNDNQVNPALAAGTLPSGLVALAWQSDASGNQDIYVATLTDGVVAVAQVTSDPADQTGPVLAIDGQDTVVVLWSDARNESSDIYGAASTDDVWTNVPVVNGDSNQSQVAVATSPMGNTLHVAWVDDFGGDLDVFYTACEGLPVSPLVGVDLIDDASDADQQAPALAVTTDADGAERVLACWVDSRNDNADLYLADVSADSPLANVFVEGVGLESDQYEAVLGVGACGDAYLVWTDDANGMRQVYCSPVLGTAPQASVETDCCLEAVDPS